MPELRVGKTPQGSSPAMTKIVEKGLWREDFSGIWVPNLGCVGVPRPNGALLTAVGGV